MTEREAALAKLRVGGVVRYLGHQVPARHGNVAFIRRFFKNGSGCGLTYVDGRRGSATPEVLKRLFRPRRHG